jgi:hypothetical protein
MPLLKGGDGINPTLFGDNLAGCRRLSVLFCWHLKIRDYICLEID